MSSDCSQYNAFEDSKTLSEAASRHIAQALDAGIKLRGRASLMLSGGQSPKPVYEALCRYDIDWSRVSIGLVDERWVDGDSPFSNANFIRIIFADNIANGTNFFGLKTSASSPESGLSKSSQIIESISFPFDVCVMGMGSDGHTASWFPGASGLTEAMDITKTERLCAIDATGCPVAGDHPQRISLTLTAVMASREIVLLLPNAEKAKIYQTNRDLSVYDKPVNALRAAGERLSVFAMEPEL